MKHQGINLVPVAWGCLAAAVATFGVQYIATGRNQVRKGGWRALLSAHRVMVPQGFNVTLDSLKKAVEEAQQEISEERSAPASNGSSYKISMGGDTYWLRMRKGGAGMSYVKVRQGLPAAPRTPHTVVLFLMQALMLPLIDPSGRAFLIARKMQTVIQATPNGAQWI